jgi:hypothetical protein
MTDSVEALFARVGPTRAKILQILLDRHPANVSREDLPGATGRHLAKLRALGLIRYPSPGQAVAAETLVALAAHLAPPPDPGSDQGRPPRRP